MALTPGTRLGVYEVTAQIGAGGMGEVYRATDTKLKRQVAIKILPPSLAADHDRLARFQREAEVLASLNHPNIASIHGFEESAGVSALVMELVEGEDLSHRISHGPISIDEALPIAKQIADALEAAHEQGIIHRDLKPANIKVRSDGTVKVLDFGLAKAMEPAGVTSVSVSMSPTITTPAMTQAGMILGTAAYMSPEQARGKPVDKRADIWAFGAVLYEMLTATRAFGNAEVSDTLAAILRADPDWSALPKTSPPALRKMLARCLEKDRRKRLADMADVRFEIEEALTGPVTSEGVVLVAPRWQRALPWAAAAALAVALAAVFVLWAPWRSASPPPPLRVTAELGADVSLVIAGRSTDPMGNAAVVSRDGTLIAFVAQPQGGGAPRLYFRRLDQLTATPLLGTEGAVGPFFSPDGQWLGFFASGTLRKIAVTGGAPVTLASAPLPRGGSWAEDGTIVFAPTISDGLWRVSAAAAGATAERLTTLAQGESTHRWPQVLPGGRAVLYTVTAVQGNFTNAWIAVQPLPTGPSHVVQPGGYYGRYLPSGHLTWAHDGTFFAAPFDLTTLAVTRPAVPVVTDVMSRVTAGNAQAEVSDTGTLVYLPGGESESAARLEWLTRDGTTMPLRATPENWAGVHIDPHGRQIAFAVTNAGKTDVWTYDWVRGAATLLPSDSSVKRNPVWTPDARRLVYASTGSGGALNLWWQPADGSGHATQLTTSPNTQVTGSWHPNGRVLAFQESRPGTNADLMTLRIDGDEASGWQIGTPAVFLDGPSTEQQPRFSPDGRWLAYESNESGRFEISVKPYPGPGGKTTISTGGGTDAVWSRARNELLYLAPDGRIMFVPFAAAGDDFRPEKPRVWSERLIQLRPGTGGSFDLDPDGTRVVMSSATAATAGPTHVTLWFNFFDELRRLAPVK